MVFEWIKKELLYVSCENEQEFMSILPMMHKHNNSVINFIIPIATIFTFFMSFGSFFSKTTFVTLKYTYIVFFVINFIILILKTIFHKVFTKYIFIVLHIYSVLLLFFGISMGILIGSEKNAVGFMAIIIIIPLLFIERPIRSMVLSIVVVSIFLYLDFKFKTFETFIVDMTNVFVYSSVSLILNIYITRMNAQRFLITLNFQKMSEIDLLTGLKNRNSFERNLENYSKVNFKSIGCVYIDVNGLGELNNTCGHSVGDEMLRLVAIKTIEVFDRENTYRIGGDEYVAFVLDEEVYKLDDNLKKLKDITQKEGYYIAVGYEIQDSLNKDIEKLIKIAEENMYKDKIQFYKNKKDSEKYKDI